mmetsp:Transcript_8272/g.20635  ORF Transcript_8272/g.20635 Transcript_8272/m.20635 type:complete len:255 (-) Transcript_8272:638-1402(-)
MILPTNYKNLASIFNWDVLQRSLMAPSQAREDLWTTESVIPRSCLSTKVCSFCPYFLIQFQNLLAAGRSTLLLDENRLDTFLRERIRAFHDNLETTCDYHTGKSILNLGRVRQAVERGILEWRVPLGVESNICGRNRYERALGLQNLLGSRETTFFSNTVNHGINVLEFIFPCFLLVVDELINCVERLDVLKIPVRMSRGDPSACIFGQLNSNRTDRRRTSQNQNPLSLFQLGTLEQTVVRSRSHQRACRRHFV